MTMNNKGFGIVEGILIVAVVALLGFVGFKAYKNYTMKDADNSQQVTKRAKKKEDKTESKTETIGTDQNANFIVFKDWGVKIPAVSGIDSVGRIDGKYSDGSKAPAGYSEQLINTPSLDKYEGCQADNDPAGVLSRQSVKAESVGSPPQLLAKIDGYYYYYSHPQSICYIGSNKKIIQESSSVQTDLMDRLEASVKKITNI